MDTQMLWRLQFVDGHHGNSGRFTYDAGSDGGFLSFFSAVWSAWGPRHPGATPGPPVMDPSCVWSRLWKWVSDPSLLLLLGNAEKSKTTVRCLDPENVEPQSSMGTVVSRAERDQCGFYHVPALSRWTPNITSQLVGKTVANEIFGRDDRPCAI